MNGIKEKIKNANQISMNIPQRKKKKIKAVLKLFHLIKKINILKMIN